MEELAMVVLNDITGSVHWVSQVFLTLAERHCQTTIQLINQSSQTISQLASLLINV